MTNSRILIVDDSLTVRMDLAEAFESAGFHVQPCADLASARLAMVVDGFDLMVLDVLLPDGDGLDLLREWKAHALTAHKPAMLLSSEADVRDRIRGMHTGADEYVGKPYDSVQVVSRARDLLAARHAVDGQPTPDPREQPLILLIDDSRTYRDALRAVLESAGMRVAMAPCGEEGLRMASSLRPDAVVVDGVMPDLNGAVVIQRMRLDPGLRRTPCLLLTGTLGKEAEVEALDAGADAFENKQRDAAVILARLQALLRAASPAPMATSTQWAPRRVLIISTDVHWRQGLLEVLLRGGCDSVQVETGEQALALLLVQPVDVIVLDALGPATFPGFAPTQDAWQVALEVCRRIKISAHSRDLPLLVRVRGHDSTTLVQAMQAGADDAIVGDMELDVVEARLRAMLRRKQFEDENRQIREQLLWSRLEAARAESARQLAEARAGLLADVEAKHAELERVHRDLQVARDRAERESRFKSRFLAGMSHELRTPLNAIIGFSELLEDDAFGPLETTQKEYVGHVLHAGRHLLSLINDILDLSKIEAGRMELRGEWVPVQSLIDEVQPGAQTLARKRGVVLAVAMADDIPDVFVDPMRVRQVLYNLLSNAIKFTPPGKGVLMRADVAGESLALSVLDEGIGIREEDIGRLFQEFEQLATVGGDKPHGTGLGLALTRRLVGLHGGTIDVQSEFGIGSQFTVRLPMLRLTGIDVPLGDPGPVALVGDGDAARSERLAILLRTCGLAVQATPAAGLAEVAAAARPAVVVLESPVSEQTLARLRALSPNHDVPVVVVGATIGPELKTPSTVRLARPVAFAQLREALIELGVPVVQPRCRSVLLLGSNAAALGPIEALLREIGCQILRGGDHAQVPDLAVIDACTATPHALDALPRGLPRLVLTAQVPVAAQQSNVVTMTWQDGLNLERIVRALAELLP